MNLAFVFTGVANTLLGSQTPLLETRWHIGDAEAGLLFSAQFFASIWAAIAVTWLARRLGYRAVVIAGLALTAAGMAGCAVWNWPWGMAAVAVYGVGLGFVTTGANLAAAVEPRGARAVMWLNWCWCLGAVGAPGLTARFQAGAWWMGAAGLVICAGLLAVEARDRIPAAVGFPVRGGGSGGVRAGWVAAAFLFVYVAVEQAISGWVASLALRSQDTARFWAVAPSIFWTGVLAGRAISPWMLEGRRLAVLAYGGLAIAGAGSLALIFSQNAGVALAAGAVCGLGLAPIYPLIVAQYASAAEGGRGPSGMVLAAGGLGGAVGPLATGFISQMTGSLRAGLAISLPAIAIMALLQANLQAAPRSAKTSGVT